MKAIAIVGKKKTGKTTLGMALVKCLTGRGLKVGVVKHSHHGFDGAEGADTEEYKKIASSVAAYSPSQSFVSWDRERTVQDLMPLMDVDVIVMEGGNKIGWLPRVLMVREDGDNKEFYPELALKQYPACTRDNPPAAEDVEQLADMVMEKGFLLPGLNCKACGRDFCMEFVADILAGKAKVSGCKAMDGDMTITCHGNELGFNPFVADMLSAGITAMLKQLKGYVPGDIHIHIKNGS
ncbi:molybdopterin-guanine dinucleotide biosynthesis protein MobB [Maridesulfovibrio hydrothermalis]|uniref:Molybdopterin-guanine dinucleotide biosynthesis protein MobB region n=1 Tax=Maridesulfovibrio hydrothermalis AM13 = DSM 14728 TaxID=1121451 RepID=L0R9U8_9BACT|nr:molybdopterin-guanine dinucleotide biosynthesis protein MobB [Maridesulfovibrio hydrothermalis]CCO22361.1 Molybdopterin-guanine dinucleotide biosynthesis protein MobB region [Maridesulfovibrio hydrothermalis AM13 = DSM 14728]